MRETRSSASSSKHLAASAGLAEHAAHKEALNSWCAWQGCMGSGIVLAWSYNCAPEVVASEADAIGSAFVTTLHPAMQVAA